MPKSVKYRSRTLTHVDRAQIRALTQAGFSDAAIGAFYGCNPRAVKRAKTNNLKGTHKGNPETDSKLLDDAFVRLVASKDSKKLAEYISSSIDASDKGDHDRTKKAVSAHEDEDPSDHAGKESSDDDTPPARRSPARLIE